MGEWEFYTNDGQLKRIEWYDQNEKIKEEIFIPEEPIKDVPLDPLLDPEIKLGYHRYSIRQINFLLPRKWMIDSEPYYTSSKT